MKKTRKILAMAACAVLLVCISVGATVAYLTSTDADSFAAQTVASAIRSTPSLSNPGHRIRLYQIRKTRIWIFRIWRNRIRIIPRN